MTEIKSKIHTYGNSHESTWPSQFGTGEKGVFHVDKDTGKVTEGFAPNPHPPHDTAPMAIFDSMPPQYHEGAQRVIESRKEWDVADKQHNKICFSSLAEPRRHVAKGIREEQKARDDDRTQANRTALKVYKANPREVKQKIRRSGEDQMKVLKKAGLTKKLKEAGVNYE